MTGVACVIVPAFNVVTSQASVRSAIQGLVDAVLITNLVGGYLIFVRDGRARGWFRELGFWADLMLSSTLVLVLFLAGRALGQVVTTLEPRRFVTSLTEHHLLYALPFFAVVAITMQFVVQMNRIIGANCWATSWPAFTTGRRPRSAYFCSLISKTQLSLLNGSEVPATSNCSDVAWTI